MFELLVGGLKLLGVVMVSLGVVIILALIGAITADWVRSLRNSRGG